VGKIDESQARKIIRDAHKEALFACLLAGVSEAQVKRVAAWLKVNPRTVAVVLREWREREKSK